MHYHLILTEKCNSQCKYCYKKSMNEENDLQERFEFDFTSPVESRVDVEKLKDFLEKDSDAVLIFYGGEPLMEIEKIKRIMDEIDVNYRMQSNGKLLDKLPIEYLKRIEKILISIDGDKKTTDDNRGEGTYDLVMKNLKKIKTENYKGEIVARMTIAQDKPEMFKQVKHLLENGFDSIHWQLDVGFYKHDFDYDKISWFLDHYNNSVSLLFNYWIRNLEEGKVLMIYPFVDIVDSILKGEEVKLRCGSGHAGYTIGTDGKIYACPIMNSMEDFVAGNLNNNPEDLKKFDVDGRCDECDVRGICGGRCLYWNKTKLWPEEGNDLVCNSIKYLIKMIEGEIPRIKDLIKEGKLSKDSFEHGKYFGPEIIP